MGLVRLIIFIAFIYMMLRFLRGLLGPGAGGPRGHVGGRPGGGFEAGQSASSDAARPRASEATRSPYDVLGVSPEASREEIRAAYQRLVQQYHPDRVQDLGPELREVAERRTKEINAAYNKLKRM